MRNPYEEGSNLWDLFQAGENLANEAAGQDERVSDSDRLTIAIYRVGAELSNSFEYIGMAIQELAEEIRDKDIKP